MESKAQEVDFSPLQSKEERKKRDEEAIRIVDVMRIVSQGHQSRARVQEGKV